MDKHAPILKHIEKRNGGGNAGGPGQNRSTYRNLFERIKPDEKEKIIEKINKKEIRDYNDEGSPENL